MIEPQLQLNFYSAFGWLEFDWKLIEPLPVDLPRLTPLRTLTNLSEVDDVDEFMADVASKEIDTCRAALRENHFDLGPVRSC